MWKDNVNAKYVIDQCVTVQGYASVLDKFCHDLIECYNEGDEDFYRRRCLKLKAKTTEVINSLIKELNAVIEREGE